MISRQELEAAEYQNKRFDLLRDIWISVVKASKGKENSARTLWEQRGFEIVPYTDEPVTSDGREVIRVLGVAYALRPEIQAQRIQDAFASTRSREQEPATKSVIGTETLSTIVCPKCGDALQHSKVCPVCAAGKLGYRHRYTCVCGGVDLISKEML